MRSTMNSKPPETRSLKTHEDPEDSAYHRLPPPWKAKWNNTCGDDWTHQSTENIDAHPNPFLFKLKKDNSKCREASISA